MRLPSGIVSVVRRQTKPAGAVKTSYSTVTFAGWESDGDRSERLAALLRPQDWGRISILRLKSAQSVGVSHLKQKQIAQHLHNLVER
jgi:hypothetical protein